MGSFTVITVKEAAITAAKLKRHLLIHDANEFITQKQWPRDAAMGRINVSEKQQYNTWLDYLGELESLDVSALTDLIWPIPPQV
ncbi:tail fiber assembly protein [Citrobacter werkmanii]